MKKKLDFVTNSSSTSFLIGDKGGDTDLQATIQLTIDLKEYVSKIVRTLEELEDRWMERYGELDCDTDKFNRCKEIIENGGAVYVLNVSDEGEPIESMLCNEGLDGMILPDNIVVIEGEGGY